MHLGLYKNGRAINPLKVITRGKEVKLSGKQKATFIANTKDYVQELDLVVSDQNRELPTKFARKESYTVLQ